MQGRPGSTALLGLVAASCAATVRDPAPPADGAPANVVVVLTDDQGYGDFSFAGHPALATPHLDALARESPLVERFYVHPVCSPTRASLMTGRWSQRTGVVDTWIGRSMMHPDEVTLAEWFGAHGYATGLFGKWHLGDCYPLRPQDQGFERTLVHRGGGLAQPSEPPANDGAYTDPILLDDGREVRTRGYCTGVYFDAAMEFVDACADAGRPFLAVVATNAPHGPYDDVPAERYERALDRDLAAALPPDGQVDREARIVAMVEDVDANVGRLLAHLDARGLAEDTLVVFLCDNGPVGGRYTAGLRGAKGDVHEGGIRSRLFVRWPGTLDPATVVDEPLAHVDLFPTLAEAAGLPLPAHRLDGRSFLGRLRGAETPPPARTLVLQGHRGDVPVPEHNAAVIAGRWKLVRASGFGREEPPPGHPFELYDLAADPGETRDLAAAHPERVAALRAEYTAWWDDVAASRPDGWAPPAIVVGHPSEPRTVLTRQDWRREEGGGWGTQGSWALATAGGARRTITLVLAQPAAVARVEVELDDRTALVLEPEELPAEPVARVPLGVLTLPAGPFRLRVRPGAADGRPVAVHQVELTPPDE